MGVSLKTKFAMNIKVNTCSDCPFMEYDGEWGISLCNLAHHQDYVSLDVWDDWCDLPSDKRSDYCPLDKLGEINVKPLEDKLR